MNLVSSLKNGGGMILSFFIGEWHFFVLEMGWMWLGMYNICENGCGLLVGI